MARKLSQMTWADIQKEMSIAGSPEKIVKLGQDVHELVAKRIDVKCIPELENAQFALERVIAELRIYEKAERKRQSIF